MFSDIMVNYILKDENTLLQPPEENTSKLPPEFFAGHASERLSDPRRLHDENESTEVKTRTIRGLVDAGIMGPLGNYTKDAPRHVAVRTHFLDSYRNPIGVNEKGQRHSNGNTIVSIIRPHKKHSTPQVQTVMLRGNNQKFSRGSGTGTMNVDHVIDASPKKINTNNPQVAIRRARKAKKKKAARVRILPPLPPGPKTVNKMVLIKPMGIAYQLLKDDDKNRTIEDAFDLGQEILPYDKLHDKQKQIVDAIANAPPSYWNDPASGELETENYAGMFENDRQHFYPDEAFNQYLRYIQHFHDASSKVNELPHEKQMEIMSHYGNFQEEHPLHPAKVALDKMAEEHEDWGGANPHEDFWQRYNEPQALMGEDSFSQDFIDLNKGEPMKIAFQLLKRNLSPAARKHKLEYDTKYQSSPERVKYRVELNRERRRRGIYGSNNKKDISHTQGGKFTLENQSSNRARHFKNRGTLRKVKVKK